MNRGIRRVGLALTALMVVLAGQLTYLELVRADGLNRRTDNTRYSLTRLRRDRGAIVTADGVVLARSVPSADVWKFQRQYPRGPEFAALTGFQSIVYGATGLEAYYDNELTGEAVQLQVGNLSALFKGRAPSTLVLNVSARAQDVAMKALAGRAGSVVALDVQTGGVVAMYSNPTFEPGFLASHDAKALRTVFGALANAPDNPMLPRAYREVYPAGSTFKVLTTATALGSGRFNATTPFPRVSSIPLPLTNRTLANFGGEVCGGTLEESFTVSCNTTFAAIGLSLGDQLVAGVTKFGLNAPPPPIDLDPGAVRSTLRIGGTFKSSEPRYALAAIGQGDVAVTPLEMALVAESVATGGTMLVPRVAKEVRNADNKVVRAIAPSPWRVVMTPAVAAELTRFMVGVVQRGTGRNAQIPGVQVAGKTGTAETTEGAAPLAWFIGFAPAEAPRYAVAVLVEHTQGVGDAATGGRVAAPIARDVLAALLGAQVGR